MIRISINFVTSTLFIFTVYSSELSISPKIEEFQNNGRSFVVKEYPIFVGSEQVFVNDTLKIRNEDYKINYNLGLITFSSPVDNSRIVKVSYIPVPFSFQKVYLHNVNRKNYDTSSDFLSSQTEEIKIKSDLGDSKEDENSSILFMGSKSIGIKYGSQQDVALDQSLHVNISGNILPDVEVEGILSDENFSIQPEGTTERLEELDKIALEMRGRNLGLVLGDYDLNLREKEFVGLQKRLTGVKVIGKNNSGRIFLAAASPRGRFTTQRFFGQDSKQGPYLLVTEEGREQIAIVGGTEHVWLDGELMKRGENNDYVIDYEQGTISFTPRRLITHQSRIAVDFQYVNNRYKRNFYGGKEEFTFGGDEKLTFGVTHFYEEDIKDKPLQFVLTDSYRNILQEAGDNTSKSVISGASFVGYGNGDYVLDSSGEADSVFVFVGVGKGDYRVTFTRVGSGKGDYRYFQEIGGYVFIGKGKGEYTHRIYLPFPMKLTLIGLDGSWKITKDLKIGLEGASSEVDKNIFSNLDRKKGGLAFKSNFSYVPESLIVFNKNIGGFEIKGNLKTISDYFTSFIRLRETEYGYRWNLNQIINSKEIYKEFLIRYYYTKHYIAEGEYGSLIRGDGLWSIRRRFRANTSEFVESEFQYESVFSSDTLSGDSVLFRERVKRDFSLSKKVRQFKPKILFISESKIGRNNENLRDGQNYFERGGNLSISLAQNDEMSLGYASRKDRSFDTISNKWLADSKTITLSSEIIFKDIKNKGISLNTNYTRRSKNFEPGRAGTNILTELARILIDYSSFDGLFRSNLNHSFTNTTTKNFIERFYSVREGDGNYRWDPVNQRYYPSENGNYRRVIEEIGEPISISELNSILRLSLLEKWEKSQLNTFWEKTSGEILFELHEKTKEKPGSFIYLINPNKLQNDEKTIFGRILLDFYISYRVRNELLFNYRLRRVDEEDNQIFGLHKEKMEASNIFRLKDMFGKKILWELGYEFNKKQRLSTENGIEKIESGHIIPLGLTHRPNTSFEIYFNPEIEWNQIFEPIFVSVDGGKIHLRSLKLTPGFRRFLKNRGKAEISISGVKRESSIPKNQVPLDILTEKPIGVSGNWILNIEYKLNEYLNASLSYTGSGEVGKKVLNLGRAEMRAYF